MLRAGYGRYAGQFLSTLSLRRATGVARVVVEVEVISIHALLAESDNFKCWDAKQRLHFYPRSPCGERLTGTTARWIAALFLSTLSLRRATAS